MKRTSDKEERFLSVTDQYKEVIAKVCMLYSSSAATFEDLYQDVLANLWIGLDSFRGEAKMSTWIYRTAINTCITSYRTSNRHSPAASQSIESLLAEPSDTADAQEMAEQLAELNRLISYLGPVDKALITLWLDEKPYTEISQIMGISPSNVAVRLHRIKEKLSDIAEKESERETR